MYRTYAAAGMQAHPWFKKDQPLVDLDAVNAVWRPLPAVLGLTMGPVLWQRAFRALFLSLSTISIAVAFVYFEHCVCFST